MNEINKANCEIWSEALRSGEYEQGTGYMIDGEGKYCCLGVALKVLENRDFLTDADNAAIAYDRVDKLLGMSESMHGPFIRANDDEGKSFAEIADMVDGLVAGTSKYEPYTENISDPTVDQARLYTIYDIVKVGA